MNKELFITVSVSSARSAIAVLHDAMIHFEFDGSNSYFFNSVEDFLTAKERFEDAWVEVEDLSYVGEEE